MLNPVLRSRIILVQFLTNGAAPAWGSDSYYTNAELEYLIRLN
jgi:hypothetical protein